MFDDTHDPQIEMRRRREAAEASIRAEAERKEAQGYALMAGFAAYEKGLNGGGVFSKINTGAKWALVWFAMIAPILLLISVRW